MLYTTTAELYCQDQKIQECGMRWDVAIKRWGNQTKLNDAMFVLKTVKIDRVLLFIRWANSIMRWAPNIN